MQDHLQVGNSILYSNIFIVLYAKLWNVYQRFRQEVFSGQKMLMKLREVKFVHVTKYDELSVKNLYDKFLTLDDMHYYFPNKYPKGRQCDREYMFNKANTLHEEITQQLIQHALKQRHSIEMEKSKQEAVMISDHWKEELKSLPMSISVSIIFMTNIYV